SITTTTSSRSAPTTDGSHSYMEKSAMYPNIASRRSAQPAVDERGPRKMMKAIAVFPGRPGSVHLAELPMPSVTDIPAGRGVLVRILRVGVDGTDKEINAAEYGEAPEGSPFRVLGHESCG